MIEAFREKDEDALEAAIVAAIQAAHRHLRMCAFCRSNDTCQIGQRFKDQWQAILDAATAAGVKAEQFDDSPRTPTRGLGLRVTWPDGHEREFWWSGLPDLN